MIADVRPAGFLNRDRHHLELERAAVRALGRDDARLAYRLADRRCRVSPLPNSQIYLLRAEALHRLGDIPAALRDVVKAIEIDPDDVAATRRLMAWGNDEQKQQAATAIVAHDHDWSSLRTAMLLLRAHGNDAFARIDIFDREISGWVTWLPEREVEISLGSDTEIYASPLSAEPQHPLTTTSHCAANFRISRPDSKTRQSLRIVQGDNVIATAIIPTKGATRLSPPPRSAIAPQADPPASIPPVTVIVPVYADYPATKACLDSLLYAAGQTPDIRVVIIDDASPDIEITHYLSTLTVRENVTVITNRQNLGFVGAINLGLEATSDGDVILLNADTVVPTGALARLRDGVIANPGVGTATPLSNNGEFTSFPVKNKSNPLPATEQLERLDQLAATANAGIVQDIPNGIGFCLYVTRACLDAVGTLSEGFHRGYMEDVDFCLRAAEAGFRNVCLPFVFVGHVGSRSFRQEKRSLVVRNLKVLQQRYPRYETECAAFLLADPLNESRGRLEAAMLAHDREPPHRVIMCDAGALAVIAMARAKRLTEAGSPTLVAELTADGPHYWVAFLNPLNHFPLSLRFDLATEIGRARFQTFFAGLAPAAIELSNLDRLPTSLLQFVLAQPCPYDILIANTELADISDSGWHRQERWQSVIDRARHVIGVDADAEDFASQAGFAISPAANRPDIRMNETVPSSRPSSLGIVAQRESAQEFVFLKEIAIRILTKRSDLDVVVIGATTDDLKLLRIPGLYVTGSVEPFEIGTMLNAYAIERLLIGLGRPLFGHPACAAAIAMDLPSVRVGWPAKPCGNGDLWIAPGTPNKAAADMILDWLGP